MWLSTCQVLNSRKHNKPQLVRLAGTTWIPSFYWIKVFVGSVRAEWYTGHTYGDKSCLIPFERCKARRFDLFFSLSSVPVCLSRSEQRAHGPGTRRLLPTGGSAALRLAETRSLAAVPGVLLDENRSQSPPTDFPMPLPCDGPEEGGGRGGPGGMGTSVDPYFHLWEMLVN